MGRKGKKGSRVVGSELLVEPSTINSPTAI